MKLFSEFLDFCILFQLKYIVHNFWDIPASFKQHEIHNILVLKNWGIQFSACLWKKIDKHNSVLIIITDKHKMALTQEN